MRWGGNVGDGWETQQVFPLFLSNKWNLGIVGDESDGYLKYQQEAERLILFMKQIYQHSGPFSFFHLHKHAAQQAPSSVFSSANKRQQKWKRLAPRPKGIVSKVTGSPRKTDVIAFSCLKLHDNKNPRFLWFVTSSNLLALDFSSSILLKHTEFFIRMWNKVMAKMSPITGFVPQWSSALRASRPPTLHIGWAQIHNRARWCQRLTRM